MKTPKKSGYKKVPHFWWDFEGNTIIVESDNDKYPVVAKFKFNHRDGDGCAMAAIESAEKYIEDLNAGRITPRKVK